MWTLHYDSLLPHIEHPSSSSGGEGMGGVLQDQYGAFDKCPLRAWFLKRYSLALFRKCCAASTLFDGLLDGYGSLFLHIAAQQILLVKSLAQVARFDEHARDKGRRQFLFRSALPVQRFLTPGVAG